MVGNGAPGHPGEFLSGLLQRDSLGPGYLVGPSVVTIAQQDRHGPAPVTGGLSRK